MMHEPLTFDVSDLSTHGDVVNMKQTQQWLPSGRGIAVITFSREGTRPHYFTENPIQMFM